ncbi:MAG: PAS domain-containing protein [Halomonas sp.]|uniref:sensor domain-containing diguanylate cyclase n=1 Tax=Halomonas sp. TaxID=1486246 RepID=UPI002870A133|nr:PAS domain-containing protein [Halomonas sp.]MDR9440384.1 PAS domain-containing protein [Halomonas sp.]
MLPEDFFSSLVERVDDVIWSVGYPQLQLEYVNPAAAAVFGRPTQEFMEDSHLWLTIVHPDDREAVAASHDRLLQEGEVERRYRILRPDGQQVWIHDRAWLMRGPQGEPLRLFGVARDVTREQVDRLRLNSVLTLHQRFIENAPDPIFLVAVQPDGEFVFRYNNPAHRQQTGVSLEVLRDQTPDTLLEASQAAAVKAHYRECVRLKHPIQYEERLTLPAGVRDWQTLLVPVDDVDGNVVELAGIARDITPFKEAERESRDAFEALDQLLQASPVVIYECQPTSELILTYVSSSVERLCGYTRSELLGHAVWHAMIHPDDATLVLAKVKAMLAGEGPIQLNYRLRHRDGHYLQVQSEKRLIRDGAGCPVKVVGAILDISDSFRLSQRLEKLAQQLPGFLYQYLLPPSGAGRFLYASRSSMAIYGATPEVLARSDEAAFSVIHPDDIPQVEASILESAETLSHWHCEYRVRHPHGHELWVEGLATPERLEDGSVMWHGYIADISERKHLQLELESSEARFRHLATVDMLTGAPNRRHFMHCLEAELARVKRHGEEACLVMFDADHFKRINDTFGHAAGDEVLKALVTAGREQLRTPDILGRMGGEEFAILLPETSLDAALEVAERFRRAIAALQVASGDASIRLTISLGVVALRVQDSPDSAVERADKALYRAKERGRDRVCHEGEEMGNVTIR